MAKPTLKDIKTSELVVDEFNVRKGEWNPNDDDENRLVDSVKAQGVLEPILVRPIKDKKLYPKNKTHSIICGSRRYHAAMEGRLKTIPSVVRTDLDDVGALGTSIQENLKRRSMGKTQTADGVGRMWDMLNGGRTYEQKMGELKKMFGMGEAQVKTYRNIYELGKSIKVSRETLDKVDTHTLAGIQTAKHWDKQEKEKAIETLSKIEKRDDRFLTLSELKQRTKENEDLDIEDAYKQYEEEVDETVGESYDVYLNAKERKATKDAAQKEKLEINTLIKRNHVRWLKENGYLS